MNSIITNIAWIVVIIGIVVIAVVVSTGMVLMYGSSNQPTTVIIEPIFLLRKSLHGLFYNFNRDT
jgi:hypothetical protein